MGLGPSREDSLEGACYYIGRTEERAEEGNSEDAFTCEMLLACELKRASLLHMQMSQERPLIPSCVG